MYTAKRAPDKTSSYGKKKTTRLPEVVTDGQGGPTVIVQRAPVEDEPKVPDEALKKQFNKVGFNVIGHLGSGTYAEVWKVEKRDTGKIWAAKVIEIDKQ